MKKILAICFAICLLTVSVFGASAQYATVDDAIAASGFSPLQANVIIDSVVGTEGFGEEQAPNLFDGDTATKFCTGTFPLEATWSMDKEYVVNGIIFATANDNSGNPGRNPDTWTLSGSNDGSSWTVVAEGDEFDFEDVDFTYYTVSVSNDKAFSQYKFDVPSTLANCFQVSELVLCGAEPAPVVVEEVAVEAPAEEAAPVVVAPVVVTAPQTSDAALSAVVALVIAGAAIVVLKKRA
jgi:F5/8 type C domain.